MPVKHIFAHCGGHITRDANFSIIQSYEGQDDFNEESHARIYLSTLLKTVPYNLIFIYV